MSAFAWLRRPWRRSSLPDVSSSNSSGLPAALRRGLRPVLAAALLGLPLLGLFASDAAAQTDTVEIFFDDSYFDSMGTPIPVRLSEFNVPSGQTTPGATTIQIRSNRVVTDAIGEFTWTFKLEGMDVSAANSGSHVKGIVGVAASFPSPMEPEGFLSLAGGTVTSGVSETTSTWSNSTGTVGQRRLNFARDHLSVEGWDPIRVFKASLSVSGNSNASVRTGRGEIIIHVTDTEPPRVVVGRLMDGSTRDSTIRQGQSRTYSMRLHTRPAGSVVVTPTVPPASPVTVSGAVTFTTANWMQEQTLTVTAGSSITSNQEVVISHEITTGDGAGYPTTLTVPSRTVSAIAPIAVTVSGGTAVTEGGDARFTVSASPAPTADLSVDLTVADDGTSDFVTAGNEGGKSVTIMANQTSATYTVATAGDNTDEPDGAVSVTVAAGSGYMVGTPSSATVTVNDDDATTVTLTTPDASAAEGDGNDTARLTLTLNRGLVDGEVLGVPLQFAGGEAETDFTLSLDGTPAGVGLAAATGTVTFTGPETGATAAAATVLLTAASDDDTDDETVTVSIPVSSEIDDDDDDDTPVLAVTGLGGGATGTRTGNGQVTLIDDDTEGVSVAETSGSTEVTEAPGASNTDTYTLVLDAVPTHDVTVTVTPESGLLVDGPDAGTTGTATETLTFTPATWNSVRTVTVFGVDDNVDQGTGRTLDIAHTASSTDTRYHGIAIDDVEVTLADDDTAGVSVAETSGSTGVTEAPGASNTDTYTLVLDTEPTHDVTVTVTPESGLLVDGPDAGTTGTATETLTFTPATWNSVRTITVFGVNDNVDQGTGRTLDIAHTASSTDTRYHGIGIGDVEVTLADDDATAVARLVLTPPTIDESGAANRATVTAVLDRAASEAVRLTVAAAAVSPAVAGDFTLSAGKVLTIDAGTVTSTGVVTITAQDNAAVAVNKEVKVSATAEGGHGVVSPTPVTLTIREDDGPPLELVDTAGPLIHLDVLPTTGVTGSGREWSLEEGTSFTVRISNLARVLHTQDLEVNYYVGEMDKVNVPVVVGQIPDGHGGYRQMTLPANTRWVTVTIPTQASSAVEHDTPVWVIPLAADAPPGTTDTTRGPGTYITTQQMLRFTLRDGPDTGTGVLYAILEIEQWRQQAMDGLTEGETAHFLVSATSRAQVSYTVYLKVEETGGGNCVAAGEERVRTLRFEPGDRVRSLLVPTVDDEVGEPHCEVKVSLARDAAGTVPPAGTPVTWSVDTGGRGGYLISTEDRVETATNGGGETVMVRLRHKADATATVRDDDPRVSFVSGSSEVGEDAGTLNLEVAVEPPPAASFALNFTLSGSASPGVDYTIPGVTGASGAVTVPAFAGRVTIPVTVVDDSVEDDGETIEVRLLTSGGYAAIAPDSVTVTVRNDDAGGRHRQESTPDWTDYRTVVNYLIDVRDNPKNTAVKGNPAHIAKWNRVLAAIGHGSPEAPMAASEIHANAARWPDSPFKAASVYLKSQEQQTPPPTPEVNITSAGAGTEGNSVTFTVTASPAPSADLAVSVTVATSGDFGYGALPGSVTIPASGSAAVTITTTDDSVDEPDGSVTLTLNAGSGYTVGALSSETVSVTDDDEPVAELTVYTVDPGVVAKVKSLASQTQHGPAHVNRWNRVLVAFGEHDGTGVTGGAMTASEAQQMADRHGSPVWDEVVAELTALEAVPQQTPPPKPEVSVTGGSGVTEGGDASFTLTASPAPSAGLAVSVTVSASGDFGAATGQKTVTIPTTGSVTFTVATTDDDADETDGSVTATVNTGSAYTVSSTQGAATVSVSDDDDAPKPEVSVTGGSGVTEGGDASFTLTASPAPSAGLAVSVTVSASGDYGAATGQKTVTVPTTGSVTFTVATTDDDADETDGSVTATLDAPAANAGYTVSSSQGAATVSVSDDDTAIVCQSSPEPAGRPHNLPAVGSLTVDTVTPGSIAVSWSAVSGADGYAVFYWEEGRKSSTRTLCEGLTDADTSYTIEGLHAATDYVVRTMIVLDGQARLQGASEPAHVTTLTELQAAVRAGDSARVRELIDEGADVDVQTDGGWTALHDAVEYGSTDMAELLLDAGADVDIQDDDGWTALHDAAYFGSSDIVELLLDAGADAGIEDDDGRTALEIAKRYSESGLADAEVVALLEAASASVITLSIRDASGVEGGEVNFEVILSETASHTIRVTYTSVRAAGADNPATGGDDFWVMTREMVFWPGVPLQEGTVFLEQDSVREGDEVFRVELSGAQGATIADGVGIMTIIDDD